MTCPRREDRLTIEEALTAISYAKLTLYANGEGYWAGRLEPVAELLREIEKKAKE